MKEQFNTNIAIKHLQEKWGEKSCPMCGHANWTVADKLFELRQLQQGSNYYIDGPTIPVFPVTCSNCGNTILVNGIVSKTFSPK